MNKEYKVQGVIHRLRVPTAIVMFGKTTEVSCEVVFDYVEETDRYYLLDCRGYFDGKLSDLAFLTHHRDFGKMISNNKPHWDVEKEWWSTDRVKENKKKQVESHDTGPYDDGPLIA